MDGLNQVLISSYVTGNNYGSLLQAFALKHCLQQMGYSPLLIEEKPFVKGLPLYTFLCLLKSILLHPSLLKSIFKRFRGSRSNINKLAAFSSFRRTYLQCRFLTFSKAKRIAKTDCVIACVCGSDQIWNGDNPIIKRFYFLTFAPKAKRVSYAPSIGRNNVAYYNQRFFQKHISQIRYLSIRESQSVDVLKSLLLDRAGLPDIEVVCDPTLLLTKEDWTKCLGTGALNNNSNNQDYVLAYFLNELNSAAILNIEDCLANHKRVVCINSGEHIRILYQTHPEIEVIDLPVEAFPATIFNADKVLTDSYHGVLFSVIGQKQFVVFRRSYGADADQSIRMVSLFNEIGLNIIFDHEKPINYASIINSVDSFRKFSLDYLRSSLNN